MKTLKLAVLFIIYNLTFNIASAQNVGINNTGAVPDASALLDVDAAPGNNKGILIPRVALTSTASALPITTPTTSLLVYNTATISDVFPGYYYWNGTKWVRMINAGNSNGTDWSLTGNAGTTAGTNFLGTTDAKDLVFKTNSVENMRILNANGNVGIGMTNPGYALDLVGNVNGGLLRGARFTNTQAAIPGTVGHAAVIVSDGTYRTMLIEWPVDHTNPFLTNAGGITTDRPGGLTFELTGGGNFKFTGGNVGIGINTAAEKLHVVGNIRSSTLAGVGNRMVQADVNGTLTPLAAGTTNQVLLGTGVWGNVPTNTAWSLTGNAGTTVGTNFLGTTDAQDLAFYTNNTEKMRITSAGNVGIGISSPVFRLTNSTAINLVDQAGGGLSGANSLLWEHPNDAFFGYVAGFSNLKTGSFTNGIIVKTVNTTTLTKILTLNSGGIDRVTVLGNGNVGIGNTAPGAALDVVLTDNATANHIVNIRRTGTGATGNGLFFTHGATVSDYNAITGVGDIGIFFDMDNNPAVSSATKGLVIAPWVNGGTPGLGTGIKITESGNVGIGTTTPTQKLHVVGTVRVVDGTQGANKVFTSDANGNASWQVPVGTAAPGTWGGKCGSFSPFTPVSPAASCTSPGKITSCVAGWTMTIIKTSSATTFAVCVKN